jgi:hypothetical protein
LRAERAAMHQLGRRPQLLHKPLGASLFRG